jgi:hypothetical protein
MAVTYAISTTTDASGQPFDQRILLSAVPYTLRFQYSIRGQVWKLSIFNDGGELLLGGISIVNGFPLLLPYHSNAEIPVGELVAIANTLPDVNAQGGDLGSRVVLYYVEPDA